MVSLAAVAALAACGPSGGDGGPDADPNGVGTDARPGGGGGGECVVETCEERGWECGKFISCGQIVDCAEEGRSCGQGESCMGGIDGPAECLAAGGAQCDVCDGIPDCSGEAQETRLRGRVVTPGRDDEDAGNQVGVPNASVFILSTSDPSFLPPIPTGLPDDGATSCRRCEDQTELMGPFLTGALTDATGHFEIEGDIPLGEEIVLVTMAGEFRRAQIIELPEADACTDIDLAVEVAEGNPTRLPRSMDEEGAVGINIPRIAVATGRIDAMECVLEKMGIAHSEFDNPDNPEARINLFRGRDGSEGMRIDNSTPADTELYADMSQLESYDIFIADCQATTDDSLRAAYGDHIREYVNRGGRMFASHLTFTWLHENGLEPYDPADPIATGLGPSADYHSSTIGSPNEGTGVLSVGRERASPRLDQLVAWAEAEQITSAASDYEFTIRDPRSQAITLGEHAEEFAFCSSNNCENEPQQFSFDTPYGAPAAEACGRVAYSGFHVAAAGGRAYETTRFPEGCEGDLTDQEKLLLFMIFDLAACIGDPVPPECEPRTCEDTEECGFVPDGCGDILDCGICPIE